MHKTKFVREIKDYDRKDRCELNKIYKSFISSNLSLRVAEDIENLNWGESYFGAPLGSIVEDTTQYGFERDEIVKENVRDYLYKNPQYNKFIYESDDGIEIATGVAIKISKSGYGIYPDPKSTIKLD